MGLGALVAITGFMRNHMGISGFIAMALALSAFGTDVGMVIAFTGPITQFPIMLTYLKIAQTRMGRKT